MLRNKSLFSQVIFLTVHTWSNFMLELGRILRVIFMMKKYGYCIAIVTLEWFFFYNYIIGYQISIHSSMHELRTVLQVVFKEQHFRFTSAVTPVLYIVGLIFWSMNYRIIASSSGKNWEWYLFTKIVLTYCEKKCSSDQ